MGDERFVLLRRDSLHQSGHVRVVAAAELGAISAEHGARELARDLEPRVVRVAGDGVELAAELGHPPGVRHVLRTDRQRDGRVDGHDHLLVGVGVVERVVVAVGICEAPDVLLAVDGDGERPAVRRETLLRA